MFIYCLFPFLRSHGHSCDRVTVFVCVFAPENCPRWVRLQHLLHFSTKYFQKSSFVSFISLTFARKNSRETAKAKLHILNIY